MVTLLPMFDCKNRFLKLVIFPNHIKVRHINNVPTRILNFYKISSINNNIIGVLHYIIIWFYRYFDFLILI